jgi:hypothetical protein
MQAGLWVVARPGPYINAEVRFQSSGRFVQFITSLVIRTIRCACIAYVLPFYPSFSLVSCGFIAMLFQTTGGGIPGWVLATDARTRTSDPKFEAAWKPYWTAMGELCAKNQWSEGGPIIMVQIENGEFHFRAQSPGSKSG